MGCLGSGDSKLPDSFRAVDTRRRCRVQPPPDYAFVSLSYVWGRSPDPSQLLATKSNIERLLKAGGLPPSRLPTTVNDAIETCRRLGKIYLWADRFCIVQDDPKDKEEQRSAMAAIYRRAKCAIVVTDGDGDSSICRTQPREDAPSTLRPDLRHRIYEPSFRVARNTAGRLLCLAGGRLDSSRVYL